MALHTTVSPSVTEDPHRPGIPDAAQTLAGYIDLNDIPDWGFLSSFAHPQMFPVTPDWSGPTFDMGEGFIYRYEAGEDWSQRIHEVGSVSSVSLASDATNYVFYTASNEFEVHDADEPPSDEAILIAVINTTAETVDNEVRGRTPLPLQLLAPGAGAVSAGQLQVSTVGADSIADTTARLRGSLDALGGASAVDVRFQYRVYQSGDAWSQTPVESKQSVGLYDADLSGLQAGVEYVFRALGIGPQGNVVLGGTQVFETTDDGTTVPTVETDAATMADSDGGILNGDLTSLGSYSSGETFHEWRSANGQQSGVTAVASTSSTGTFQNVLVSLPSGTTYEFRAGFEYADGTVYGDWLDFTTTGSPMTVTTDAETGLGDHTATLNGTLDDMGPNTSADVGFEFRETGDSVWKRRNAGFVTTTGSFSHDFDSLIAGTQYEYRATAQGTQGTTTGSTETFTTTGTPPGSSATIDGFEDGDISEYTGDTADFDVQTNTVYQGTYALKINGDTPGIFSTSGLPTYPSAGDTFEYRAYLDGGSPSTVRFFFGYTDSNNHYFLDVQSNDVFRLRVVDGGNQSEIDSEPSANFSVDLDTWYRVTVDWGSGGSFTCTLFDDTDTQIAQISGSDSSHSSGGIGWRSGSSLSTSYVDELTTI